MEKLLEILDKHKDKEIISYTINFDKSHILVIKFNDGSVLELCEHTKQNLKK